jgi:exodeoxyribonuclease VII large subunit
LNNPTGWIAVKDDAVQKDDLFADAGVPVARPSPPPPVVSVSAFVSSARLLLERNLALQWISGEVSGCSRAASGHLYFTLKDSKAQIKCVFFRSKAQALSFALREGLAVEVRATPSIYEARGEFQLNVESVRLAGLGALYERFVQLKARLSAAGLFEVSRKRALPTFPARVGIITSRRAAALRDVLTTLARRFPGIPVILYPASVQGPGAAGEIAAAIRRANAHAHVDVLIVARGGGSLEDLWAFNEEVVARAVFDSRLPIVSGVGHETDFTICDFVADVRAPTPTGAAALVVPDRMALLRRVQDLGRRLARAATHTASNRAQRLDRAARALVHPAARLARQRARARELGERLARAFGHRRIAAVRRVDSARARLCRELRAPVPQTRALAHAANALARAARDRVARARREVERHNATLALLNPESVLERGYAIVATPDGTIVADARQLSAGDDVRVTFANGRAAATITATETTGE